MKNSEVLRAQGWDEDLLREMSKTAELIGKHAVDAPIDASYSVRNVATNSLFVDCTVGQRATAHITMHQFK